MREGAGPTGPLVLIGTYTQKGSEGIYLYRLDRTTGALHPVGLARDMENPSYLAIHPTGRFLYAVNELEEGALSAYRLDRAAERLERIGQQPSLGAHPCYVSIDAAGRYAYVVNYTGGSVTVLPIVEDGSLGAPSDSVQHRGAGPNPDRQERAHPHSVVPDPTGGRFVFVPDLGIDRVFCYRLDGEPGALLPNELASTQVQPGAGPRHLLFHPSARFAYLVNELASTVTAFAYEPERGGLEPLQTVSTLPPDFTGANTGADIQVHPSGRFLYASNRGHDSIAIFAVDPETGRLTPAGHQPTHGKIPRNICLDPGGDYLLAANQWSDSVTTFRIDGGTGRLTFTGHRAELPVPVCIKMVE